MMNEKPPKLNIMSFRTQAEEVIEARKKAVKFHEKEAKLEKMVKEGKATKTVTRVDRATVITRYTILSKHNKLSNTKK